MEIFKDTYIDGYEVSNYGRVFTKRREIKANASGGKRFIERREKKASNNGKGYKWLWLYKEGKKHREYVHRLVAIAFIPNPENKKTVNHIDGDKGNNRVDNLAWATQRENNQHAVSTGLIRNIGGGIVIEQLNKDTDEVINTFKSASEASRVTGISRSSIQGVCRPHRKGQKRQEVSSGVLKSRIL